MSLTPDLLHRPCKLLEILGVCEVLVDAGEADIGDAVEAFQPLHHHLADRSRRDLAFAAGFQLALDA